MEKEIRLFVQLPELLLCGNNNGIAYDRKEVERRFIDGGIQRTSNIKKFRDKNTLINALINNDAIPEIIKI